MGDRAGEGKAYSNLSNAYFRLGDFQKSLEYRELHFKISQKLGDREGEINAYGNLGIVYDSLGDFHKAIEFHERALKILKQVGNRAGSNLRSYSRETLPKKCNLSHCVRRYE